MRGLRKSKRGRRRRAEGGGREGGETQRLDKKRGHAHGSTRISIPPGVLHNTSGRYLRAETLSPYGASAMQK